MFPPIHPLQAIFLASTLPLFFGALFSDIAYARSFEVQWKNFASWLLVDGLAMSLVAFVWAMIDFIRRVDDRSTRRVVYVVALLAMCVLGFANALVHAADAWGSMPTAMILSVIIALLSATAAWIGFAGYRDVRTRMSP